LYGWTKIAITKGRKIKNSAYIPRTMYFLKSPYNPRAENKKKILFKITLFVPAKIAA